MIALDRKGRTSGYVVLHNSTDESAWQQVRLPIHCFNGTPGPTTLVLGGMHGDEYEGPVAIDTLAHDVDPINLTGRLILISSAAAIGPGGAAYGAAKAALHGWMYDLAVELGPAGVTCNIVSPGFIDDTDLFGGRLSEERRASFVERTPWG